MSVTTKCKYLFNILTIPSVLQNIIISYIQQESYVLIHKYFQRTIRTIQNDYHISLHYSFDDALTMVRSIDNISWRNQTILKSKNYVVIADDHLGHNMYQIFKPENYKQYKITDRVHPNIHENICLEEIQYILLHVKKQTYYERGYFAPEYTISFHTSFKSAYKLGCTYVISKEKENLHECHYVTYVDSKKNKIHCQIIKIEYDILLSLNELCSKEIGY
jgi:hypothetical protein